MVKADHISGSARCFSLLKKKEHLSVLKLRLQNRSSKELSKRPMNQQLQQGLKRLQESTDQQLFDA